ncbi:histidine kinase with GAF domain [Leptolyngbyaceae cyanobacterium JSC-12]|nr:histidine kinase with GAF domain [Leptolyngbyaceae cyanobacterium JSC-12]
MDWHNIHPQPQHYQQDRCALELLTAPSYRSGDLSQYLHEIACGVSCLLGSDWSIVTICQGELGQVVANSLGLGEGDHSFAVHGTLASEVTETGRSLVIEDIRQEIQRCNLSEDYLSYLGVPLRTVHGEIRGTICSFFRQPRQFTEAEIRSVELFAERAATAIDNYHLYHRQQKFNEILEQEVANRTEELRVAQTRLVEQERLAAIGEFATTIVHEVRNPLTTIVMGLKYARKQLETASDADRLFLSLSEAERLQHLLNEILLYAKPQLLQLFNINIGYFLQQLLEQIREMPEATQREIQFTTTTTDVELLGDRDKLKQVFINLFRNACEAIAEGDTIQCELTHLVSQNQVCVTIQNRGEPIPAEILPRLTEPFYSTKPSGTGLGLAIVKRIVLAHNGELSIQSSAQFGTVVQVRFPIRGAKSEV